MQRSAIILPKSLDASSTLVTTIPSRLEKPSPEHFQQDDIGVEVLDDHMSFEFELITKLFDDHESPGIKHLSE